MVFVLTKVSRVLIWLRFFAEDQRFDVEETALELGVPSKEN
jgi:hypothetical protein